MHCFWVVRSWVRASVTITLKQWTEFHQTLVDDVVEGQTNLLDLEGRRVKVKVTASSSVWVTFLFYQSRTRGNSLKIVNRRCHYDLRKYSFCNRITHVWKSLPEDIVTAASDSFCSIQELLATRNNRNRKHKWSSLVKIFKVSGTLITYYSWCIIICIIK